MRKIPENIFAVIALYSIAFVIAFAYAAIFCDNKEIWSATFDVFVAIVMVSTGVYYSLKNYSYGKRSPSDRINTAHRHYDLRGGYFVGRNTYAQNECSCHFRNVGSRCDARWFYLSITQPKIRRREENGNHGTAPVIAARGRKG